MKSKKINFCSAVLSVTTLLSMLTFLPSNAAENTQPKLDILTSTQKGETEFGTKYYGATGDIIYNDDNRPKDVTVIESVDEYNKVASTIPTMGINNKPLKKSGTLPASVDNSQSPYFPQIGNQGSLGSCTFWAQVYYQFTYTMNKEMKRTTTPENTFSPQWTYNVVAGTDEMIGPYYDAYNFMQRQGNVSLSLVPYDLNNRTFAPKEEIWKTAHSYRLKEYQKIQSVGTEALKITSPDDEDLATLKTAINNGDVLAYSSFVYSFDEITIKSNSSVPESNKFAGQKAIKGLKGKEGAHRMTIVGYNDNIWIDINENNKVDSGEMGAFKIANSWGDGWGNNGFMWIAYDALNEVSCVEGIEQSERESIFGEITRIEVLPYSVGNDIYATYTLNTADRTQVLVSITAEKDGTEHFRRTLSNEYSGEKIAYDGSNTATDATMTFLLSNVVPELTSENFNDYTWYLNFEDKNADGKPLIVKDAKIIDEIANKTYSVNNGYPFTLDGSTKSVMHSETNLNHAVVYYRGYEAPQINYKVGNGSWVSDNGIEIPECNERRGYTHKYVIDLGSNNNATLYFTDGNGRTDNNNGKYFTATKGLNYYATENVGKPINITLTNDFNNLADIDRGGIFTTEVSGGYAPYMYQFTFKNIDTGSETTTEYDDKPTETFYFREAGNYKVTVNVKDTSDTVASKTIDIKVEDLAFEFTSFDITSQKNVLNGQEVKFTAVTANEHIRSWGNMYNKYTFTIKKGDEVCYTNTKLSNKVNIGGMTSTIDFLWTPTQTGRYSITISSTEYSNQYAEKTIYFDIKDCTIGDANGDGKIDVNDVTALQLYIAKLSDEFQIHKITSDTDKDLSITISDATYIQMYIARYDNSGSVGEVIIPEQPVTEPTTQPTTQPTTVQPTTVAVKNKVTFTNSFSWGGTISCYYWSDSNKSMTTWPGKAMTYSATNDYGEKMFTFEVPKDATYIIFTNGSSQTVDIPYSGGEVRYYPLSSTDSSGHNNVATW